jgi:hypothetical protein
MENGREPVHSATGDLIVLILGRRLKKFRALARFASGEKRGESVI